jgi:hypothetical protein
VAFKDLTNQRFGRWIVLSRAENNELGQAYWHCGCDCGTERVVRARHLAAGATKSCGCLRHECVTNLSHGQTRGGKFSPEYTAWAHMHSRCYNPNNRSWKNYGGRGIKILFTSFEQFYAELGKRPKGTTVGRINNNGHYEPGNVRWERPRPQGNNKRNNRMTTAFGRTETIATWARMLNVEYHALWQRLIRLRSMPPEKAMAHHVRIPTGCSSRSPR